MDAALAASHKEVDSFNLGGELILIFFIMLGTVCLVIHRAISITASADRRNPQIFLVQRYNCYKYNDEKKDLAYGLSSVG